jgi:hypothetical protein
LQAAALLSPDRGRRVLEREFSGQREKKPIFYSA